MSVTSARSLVTAQVHQRLARKAEVDTDSETTDKESMAQTTTADSETDSEVSEVVEDALPLGPGLYHDDIKAEDITPAQRRDEASSEATTRERSDSHSSCSSSSAFPEGPCFTKEETLFVFDWDDTILPSSWIRSQGLRLDDGSKVTEQQKRLLAEVAPMVMETLQLAKQHGTVVMVTSAERGWIELSCRKFLPTVMPMLENLRMVSARTMYEGPRAPNPLDWKICAFEAEIARFYGSGALQDALMRKNVFSLGDGAHEREALLRTCAAARNCRAKSLKFVDRPELSQIMKQHELICGNFASMLQHDADLDLCIRCP